MKQFMFDFLKDEEGLTMVEYAIAGALVAGTCVVVFTNLGTAIVASITKLTTAVST
jgi:pilus assembly protein Flp/PilA